jgi:hypothetical protein
MTNELKIEIAKGTMIRLACRHSMSPRMMAHLLDTFYNPDLVAEYTELYQEACAAEEGANPNEPRFCIRTISDLRNLAFDFVASLMGPDANDELVEVATNTVLDYVRPEIDFGWRYTLSELHEIFEASYEEAL